MKVGANLGTMADSYIMRAGPRDAETLTQLLFKATFNTAPYLWLFETTEIRRDRLPDLLRVYVEHALANGLVYTTQDRAAAALWHTHRGGPLEADPVHAARIAAAVGADYEDRARAYAACTSAARTTEPHNYLHIAAVDPAKQRRGIGTRLLAACHEDLAQTGRPAQLAAYDEDTRGLCRRSDYADVAGPAITLPWAQARLLPMRRPWIPRLKQHVTVREHVAGWSGEHGLAISLQPLACKRPVQVAIDDDELRDFALDELEPTDPHEPEPGGA